MTINALAASMQDTFLADWSMAAARLLASARAFAVARARGLPAAGMHMASDIGRLLAVEVLWAQFERDTGTRLAYPGLPAEEADLIVAARRRGLAWVEAHRRGGPRDTKAFLAHVEALDLALYAACDAVAGLMSQS